MNKNKITLEDPPEYEITYDHAIPIFRSKKDLDVFHDLQVKQINEEIKKAKRIKRIEKF